jgi:hypothetical protein
MIRPIIGSLFCWGTRTMLPPQAGQNFATSPESVPQLGQSTGLTYLDGWRAALFRAATQTR